MADGDFRSLPAVDAGTLEVGWAPQELARPTTVHGLLIEAAGRVEGVEREPEPWVFQRSINDYHITYEICCVTRESHQQLLLYSRLHEEIQDAFARAGVEILSPAYSSLRDANAPVLPDEPKGPRAEPGGFRIRPRDA